MCLFLYQRLAVKFRQRSPSYDSSPCEYRAIVALYLQTILIILRNESTLCTFFLTPLKWQTKKRHPESSFSPGLLFNTYFAKSLLVSMSLSFCFCSTCLKLHYFIHILVSKYFWAAARDLSGGDWAETVVFAVCCRRDSGSDGIQESWGGMEGWGGEREAAGSDHCMPLIHSPHTSF